MLSSMIKEFITCEKSKPLGVYERFKFKFSQNIEEQCSAMAMLWYKNCFEAKCVNEIIEKLTENNHVRCDDTVLNREKLNYKLNYYWIIIQLLV